MPAFANSSTADTVATCVLYGDITYISRFWHYSCSIAQHAAASCVLPSKVCYASYWGMMLVDACVQLAVISIVACAVNMLTKQM